MSSLGDFVVTGGFWELLGSCWLTAAALLGWGLGLDAACLTAAHKLLLSLGGHRGETWALEVSSLGDFVVTGGAQKLLLSQWAFSWQVEPDGLSA